MAKRKTKKRAYRKHKRKNQLHLKIVLGVLVVTMLFTGFYLKNKIAFYFRTFFPKFEHRDLRNSEFEAKRINRIISENTNKTFGIDMSHYQRKEDIQWDSLSIANGAIPIDFIVLRATMGNRSTDEHFSDFWTLAKEKEKIRGAYHFYRANEDPVLQANNFLAHVKLESGDLPPILDIEKIPTTKSKEQLVKDLKIWCKIMEEKFGKKPIIYSYYHYYKDYLKGHFDDYPLWLANYNDVPQPSPEDNWDFWQFSEQGIVYGINTKVDLDVYNGNLWSLQRMTLD